MQSKLIPMLRAIKNLLYRYRKLVIVSTGLFAVLILAIVAVCGLIIDGNKQYILPANSTKHVRVGIVLGAGITHSGKPFRELQARLDVAATALNKGQVDRLLLSGDNSIKKYNEPDAMRNYLVNVKHIDSKKLQPDYAGRSTYASCERASKIFGLHETIIYSAHSHLPRAIYLCRHFGITAYGVSSGVEANNSTRRELLARVKAVYNVEFFGERTILGKPIKI